MTCHVPTPVTPDHEATRRLAERVAGHSRCGPPLCSFSKSCPSREQCVAMPGDRAATPVPPGTTQRVRQRWRDSACPARHATLAARRRTGGGRYDRAPSPRAARPRRCPHGRMGDLACDGISAGQRGNIPPVYLRRSSVPTGRSPGWLANSPYVRTRTEAGRGPTQNRDSSRTGRAESVLIPRGPAGC